MKEEKKREKSKEEQEKLEKIEKEKREKNFEKQVKIVLAVCAVLIVSIVLFYVIGLEMKKFHYLDLKFEKKATSGTVVFYYTEIPLRNVEGDVTGKVPVYLREDPRKLDRIKINGTILLKSNVAIAEEPELRSCSDGIIAVATISGFLASAGLNPTFVTTNISESNETGVPIGNCSLANEIGYSFVQFIAGNETKITQKEENCYIIETANCEIMNASDRFDMGVYANSKGIII